MPMSLRCFISLRYCSVPGRSPVQKRLSAGAARRGNIVSPDLFIPVFERKFMINRLDQYVFEEVCRWLHRLLLEGKDPPGFSECFPPPVLRPGFRSPLCGNTDRYEIPPELLEIEFTESILVDNTPPAAQNGGGAEKGWLFLFH